MNLRKLKITGDFEVVEDYALVLRLFGRTAEGSLEVLTLQRALDPDDDKPGLDGVYIERGEQEMASYGAVRRCELSGRTLHLSLDAEGTEALGGIDSWEFDLEPAMGGIEKLSAALRRIFEGCDCLVIR